MLPVPRFALVVALLGGAPAYAQDLKVVAELGRVGPPTALSVQTLTKGGSPSLVSVGRGFVNVWLLDGSQEPVVTAIPETYRQFTFGDFDGDGFLDLAAAGGAGIDILKGDGKGSFAPSLSLARSGSFNDLSAADVDGDGRPDLVVVDGVTIQSFLSRGGLRFDGPFVTPITTYGGAGTVSAGDLDGDGRADVVLSGMYRGYPSVWLGAGDGTFRVTSVSLPGRSPGRVLLADLTGTGRLDLAYPNSVYIGPDTLIIYANDGHGQFRGAGGCLAVPGLVTPSALDVDGDGRNELVDLFRADHYSLVVCRADGPPEGERLVLPLFSPLLEIYSVAALRYPAAGATFFLSTREGIVVLARAGARTDRSIVPVVVSTTGLFGSRFDSDLLLTNSGSTPAHVILRYAAADGGGSGVVEKDLGAGAQLIAPSAVKFLRDEGLPIGVGNVVGTLRLDVTGASSPRAVTASVRTTSPSGAGVSCGGVPLASALRGPAIVPWLKEDARDRTNLALVNAGGDAEGPITLRVTVHPGTAGAESPAVLPDVTLPPGGFFQFGRILRTAGLAASVGWARVERVSGGAPYLSWAVVNDAGTSDGSFVAGVVEEDRAETREIPNAVQTARYTTELVATNPGDSPLGLVVRLGADPFQGPSFTLLISAGETSYVPDLFAEFRRRGVPGAPPAEVEIVSSVSLSASGFIAAGVRVSSSPAPGRSYGVFESARYVGRADSVVIPDLRQDAGTRSNVGVSPGSGFGFIDFRVEIRDPSGALAGVRDGVHVESGVLQMNAILRNVAPGLARGWARIIPSLPVEYAPPAFTAYGVINDGAEPGQGTDDGSFVPAVPE
ncbi:MAG TPA: VCBS repeat-containing protein [Thermoanaerobaculia bacterium]|nr:VCBS repeat-containing protein [Thermoanaerobaculia bacterium]